LLTAKHSSELAELIQPVDKDSFHQFADSKGKNGLAMGKMRVLTPCAL